MPNRRGFLQAGIAVSFLPVLSRSTLAASAPIVFDQVVFDQRFAVARDFARRAQQAGLKCAVIQGDITDLYFHNLAFALEERNDDDCRDYHKRISVLFGDART